MNCPVPCAHKLGHWHFYPWKCAGKCRRERPHSFPIFPSLSGPAWHHLRKTTQSTRASWEFMDFFPFLFFLKLKTTFFSSYYIYLYYIYYYIYYIYIYSPIYFQYPTKARSLPRLLTYFKKPKNQNRPNPRKTILEAEKDFNIINKWC